MVRSVFEHFKGLALKLILAAGALSGALAFVQILLPPPIPTYHIELPCVQSAEDGSWDDVFEFLLELRTSNDPVIHLDATILGFVVCELDDNGQVTGSPAAEGYGGVTLDPEIGIVWTDELYVVNLTDSYAPRELETWPWQTGYRLQVEMDFSQDALADAESFRNARTVDALFAVVWNRDRRVGDVRLAPLESSGPYAEALACIRRKAERRWLGRFLTICL